MERTREQERSRGLFRTTAQVPAAIPSPAQPSTTLGALHAMSLISCPSAADDLQIHEENSGGRDQCHGHCGQSILSHLQNQGQCCPAGHACGGGSFQSKASKQPVAWLRSSQELLGHASCSLRAFEAVAVRWEGKHLSGKLGTLLLLAAFQVSLCLLQVLPMVRFIHQWLKANEFPEYNLCRPLLDLTEAQPADVVMALLRVAPWCDRYRAHVPRGLRASPCTAWPRCLTNRGFQGPVAPPFVSPGTAAPEPAALRGQSPQGWAATEGQWAEAGLAASSAPCCCPGHGDVSQTPLTQNSVPTELLPPCGRASCARAGLQSRPC